MLNINNDILKLNLNDLISNINHISEVEYIYAKHILQFFISKQYYDLNWSPSRLDKIKERFHLKYKEIHIDYYGKLYICRFNESRNKHLSITGYKQKSMEKVDIIFDISFMNDFNKDTYKDYFQGIDIIQYKKIENNIRVYRDFLNVNYKLSIDEIIGDAIDSLYKQRQLNAPRSSNFAVIEALRQSGYKYEVKYIEGNTVSFNGNYIIEDFNTSVTIKNIKNNKEEFEGYEIFLNIYISYLLKLYTTIFLNKFQSDINIILFKNTDNFKF